MLSINLEYFSTKKMKYTILSLSSPPEIKLLTVMTAFNPLMVRHTLKILKQPVYLRIIKIDTK